MNREEFLRIVETEMLNRLEKASKKAVKKILVDIEKNLPECDDRPGYPVVFFEDVDPDKEDYAEAAREFYIIDGALGDAVRVELEARPENRVLEIKALGDSIVRLSNDHPPVPRKDIAKLRARLAELEGKHIALVEAEREELEVELAADRLKSALH